MPSQDLLTDPRAQSALLGLIEVRRNRAVVLRLMGRAQEADALLTSATDLARGNGLSRPIVNARLYRTSGLTAAAQGLDDQALADLLASTAAFDRSLPGSKPLADTYLLRARQLAKAGKGDSALPICRNAVQSLAALKAGTTPVLMASCLDVYAAAAERQKDQRQVLLAEMFTAAQLAQGGITSQQIAQATARLSENSRDPKVAEAIRHRQDASAKLSDLYRQRDELADAQRQGAAIAPNAATAADLDKQISDAQSGAGRCRCGACRRRRPITASWCRRWCRPRTCSPRCTRTRRSPRSRSATTTAGCSCCATAPSRCRRSTAALKQIGELVRRVRAGIELTTAGLPTFDIADAQKLYQMTLGGVAERAGWREGAGRGACRPAAVAAVRGAADRSGRRRRASPRRRGWCASSPSRMCRRRRTSSRCARSPAGSRATHPWFGFGDFHPVTLAQAEKTFSGAGCGESAKLLAGLPPLPYARKELRGGA